MIDILLCILSTTSLLVTFKVVGQKNIQTFPTIVINYLACVVTGIIVRGHFPPVGTILHEPWLHLALILGVLFITVFNLIGMSSFKAGVTITALANKMSLVIPITAAFILYGDSVSFIKIAGIILALVAMFMATYRDRAAREAGKANRFNLIILPILVFIGSGTVDTLVNYVQAVHLVGISYAGFLIFLFLTAASIGLAVLPFYLIKKKVGFGYRELIAGIVLGVPNYASLHFMLRSLEHSGLESTVVFPLINIGVITLSTLIAYFYFKEQLTKVNLAGVGLALAAIAILSITHS